MANQLDYDGDIFIYRGGRAPRHVKHVRIHESVDEVEEEAFRDCHDLVQVDTHDGIRKVGKSAFHGCKSLRRINLKSAVEIDKCAFFGCENLQCEELGDRLETIGCNAFGDRLEVVGDCAFDGCRSLWRLKLPSIITIGKYAFGSCLSLADVELSARLESIGASAFYGCENLQRIAIPLKRDLFEYHDVWQRYTQFDGCRRLKTVYPLVGGIHKTVSLRMDTSWRTEMTAEINRKYQVLPKKVTIQKWMESFVDKMDHHIAEHCKYVKEVTSLLELALGKAKLGEKEESSAEEGKTKKAKVDAESARKERRIICGADVVIKNVLPFLQVEE